MRTFFNSPRVGLAVGLCVLAAGFASAADPFGTWTALEPQQALSRTKAGPEWVRPVVFEAIELDLQMMETLLAEAPPEFSTRARTNPALVTVPLPDGTYETFELVETEVMAPGLRDWFDAQGYPMRTYRGRGIEDPLADIRVDFGGPGGFHASIFRGVNDERIHIDRLNRDDVTLYASYRSSDLARTEDWTCGFVDENPLPSEKMPELFPKSGEDDDRDRNTGGDLRIYRTAVAATGEYTSFHGGTVAAGQAAIVTSMNRVNQVYERDLAVRMTLIPNNNLIVYTNSSSDPYTNNSGGTMLGQNQSNIDNVIGNSNYDIGHVFSTGGGGVASLGSICSSSSKARGVTGQGSPVGDPFDIDYVSHEMGHQFGGRHTFNGSNGACGGNRSGSAAYEPGSGVTIQAYAGICGADNIASNSIPHFHAKSLEEMFAEISSGPCFSATQDVNLNEPTVEAGPGRTIPANTPIWLEARDGFDGDAADQSRLTYCWEQYDLGPQQAISQGDTGDGPITRPFSPTSSPVRTIPRLLRLGSGGSDSGNIVPDTNRGMSFRVTVRDNNPAGGRTSFDTLNLSVTTSVGPFEVTAPTGGVQRGVAEVLWNVNGTNVPPVDAQFVDILLSTDGGLTFDAVLLEATPNDGMELVNLPQINSSSARILVKGTDHNFFNISPQNFVLEPFQGPIVSRSNDIVIEDVTGNGNGNGFSDPGETDLRFDLELRNIGTETSLATTATLTSLTPGVTVVGDTISFGSVLSQQTVAGAVPFVFAVDEGALCGGQASFDLTVEYGVSSTSEQFSVPIGQPGGPATTLDASFDASLNLPAGWTREVSGPDNWAVRNFVNAQTLPNVLSVQPGPGIDSDVRVISPTFNGGGELTFWHTFAIERGYDGAILEVSVDGGPFEQVTTFTQGGYNGVMNSNTSSPLANLNAWTGGELSNLSQVRADLSTWENLPIRLAFRFSSDVSIASAAWRIDTVRVEGQFPPLCEPALELASPTSWMMRGPEAP